MSVPNKEQPAQQQQATPPAGDPNAQPPKQDENKTDPNGGNQPPKDEDPSKSPEVPKGDEATKDVKKEEPAETGSNLVQLEKLVVDAGLDVQTVVEAVQGNEGKIDAMTMLKLTEKYGEGVAGLIKDQIADVYKKQVESVSKRDQEVFDQVAEAFKDVTEQSGEESWKELSGWAKDNVSNDHRKELNKMLAQGGLAAKLAVQELVTAFKEGQGQQEFQDAQLLDGDGTSKEVVGAISKAEYDRELRKLLDSGHDYDTSREVKALQNRRLKAVRRGQ